MMSSKSIHICPPCPFRMMPFPSISSIPLQSILFLLISIHLPPIWANRNPSTPPFGLSEEVFTKQAFDEDAPFCKVEKEPCGFYDLSLNGNTQLEWVKSWCRCPPLHECAFDEPDLRHKVYRFVCKKEQQKQQTVAAKTTPGATAPNRNRLVVRRRTRHGHGHHGNGGHNGQHQ